MSKIPTYAELLMMTDQQLVERYDREAEHTVVGTGFYIEELNRRAQTRQSEEILQLTRQMSRMTVMITLMTLLNTVLVGVTVWTALK